MVRSLPNLTANLVPTWPILATLGPSWRQHRLQEASKWSSTGGPDRIWVHLGAKRMPKSSTLKNGDHFPANWIYWIYRKRNMQCGTDPGFPTPGARMTVISTNSLKLSNIVYTSGNEMLLCFRESCQRIRSHFWNRLFGN